MLRLAVFVLALTSCAVGGAASFPCEKAGAAVERMICGDRELSGLDDSMADVFESHRSMGDASEARVRSTQRTWLAARNACKESACLKARYLQRLTELWCDDKLLGSAIGAGRCAEFTLATLEPDLTAAENRYAEHIKAEADPAAQALQSFADERKAWRTYRSAQCRLEGAVEGGAPGWKNARAAQCEVDATRSRVNRLKKLDSK